jgi:hypothetical protein
MQDKIQVESFCTARETNQQNESQSRLGENLHERVNSQTI